MEIEMMGQHAHLKPATNEKPTSKRSFYLYPSTRGNRKRQHILISNIMRTWKGNKRDHIYTVSIFFPLQADQLTEEQIAGKLIGGSMEWKQ